MSDNMFSKTCDLCGLQPAILFFRTFNGEFIGEEGLCPQCALKRFSSKDSNLSNDHSENDEILDSINTMRNILSEIIGQINKFSSHQIKENDSESNNMLCPICQTDLNNVENNMIGCYHCFDIFNSTIRSKLHDNSFGYKHQGHIPTRLRTKHFKELELEKLNLKLQELIRNELYEDAAKINKRIKKLEQ